MLVSGTAGAGQAEVVAVEGQALDGGQWRLDVTVAHADEGWEHYANRFDVLAPDGTMLGERILHHPHVNEQPFTRSLTLTIPGGIDEVQVRAVDSVHGENPKTYRYRLER